LVSGPSYYEASAGPRTGFPRLEGEVVADACVVGGGYTGLSAALYLAESGLRVVLLEAGRVGDGASGRNGGQVGSGQRRGVLELEARLGPGLARLLWDLAQEAKALVADRVARHDIDCEYRPGNLLALERVSHQREVARETEHLAARYGYDRMELLDRGEIRRRLASPAYLAGRLDRGGGHLHPLRLALGLARAAATAGVGLFEDSTAVRIAWGRPARVHTSRGSVRATHVLLCGNAYLDDTLAPRLAGRVLPISSHQLATEPLGEERARGLILDGCCVHDARFVPRYFRCSVDHRLIFGGGETWGPRPPRHLAAGVRRHMQAVFPQLSRVRVDYAWSGRVAITMDRLPDYGRVGSAGWYAHGFSGHGVALAQLAGRLLAEAVVGSAGRFDVLASIPHRRFPGGRWLRQPLLVAAMLWYTLRDRL
jgi:gamma-glutamylputrescine oxidase